MARSCLMSWDARNGSWQKMYKGQRYFVTCGQLGCPATKQASYQAANVWWSAKVATLAPIVPTFRQLSPSVVERQTEDLQLERGETAALLRYGRDQLAQHKATGRIPVPAKIQYVESFATACAADQTIGHHRDKFLEGLRAKGKTGGQTYREIRKYLERITATAFLNESLPIGSITEKTIDDHFSWLGELDWQPGTKNKHLNIFRRFVRWAVERKLCENPRNLESVEHKYGSDEGPNEIKTFEGVSAVVDSLPMPQKLWAMLGLNCSMTQADLGALKWEQIDTKKWYLTRIREKTKKRKNSRKVTYKLWPETIALLKAMPTSEGLVFRTSSGEALYVVRPATDDKPETKKDLFSLYWRKDRMGVASPIPMGKFRSIGATALKKSETYRGFVEIYLAHGFSTTADKHYGKEADNPFFKALAFIRQTLFKAAKKKVKTK